MDTEICLISLGIIKLLNRTPQGVYKTLEFAQNYQGPYESQIQT